MRLTAWLLALCLFPHAPLAWGWGHLSWIDGEGAPGYLIHRLGGDLSYCVRSEDTHRFPLDALALETEAALSLWIRASQVPGTRLRRVKCGSPQADLVVSVGRHGPASQPAVAPIDRWHGRWVAQVLINTAFREEDEGHVLKYRGFFQLLGTPPGREPELLEELSRDPEASIYTLSDATGVPWWDLYNSTYVTLIHELGHSFGLCDTYDGEFEEQCDPRHRLEERPDSVMKTSTWLTLRTDDVEGIRALVERYGLR
jgi:hypothetical protein